MDRFVGADGRAKEVSLDNPLPVTITNGTTPGGGDASAAKQDQQTAQLSAINADLGAPADAPAASDNATAGLIPLWKRALQGITTIIGRLPALVGGLIPVVATASATDVIGNGTRQYDWFNGLRQATTSASTAATALPSLGISREVMFHASSRCFVRMGDSGVIAATAGAGQMVVEAGERFHIRIPTGTTHFRVIRDTADGFLNVVAVL